MEADRRSSELAEIVELTTGAFRDAYFEKPRASEILSTLNVYLFKG